MPFIKGQSGNANGARVKSPEQREFERKCREWCRDYAFDKLKRVADLEDDKRSDWAVDALINRAFGKAVETSVIDASVTAPSGSSAEDLARELAALIPGAEDKGGGNDQSPKVDA